MKIERFNPIRYRLILSLILLASLALTGFAPSGLARARGGAQQQGPAGQSMKGAKLKGKVPVNKEVLKVNLPKARETTLKNGLKVIVLEGFNKVPTFSMQMVILSGGLADPKDQHGLASFTASLLREGAGKRTSREIAEQIDTLGATLSAGAGLSSLTSTVSASGLVENLDTVLDIFADVVRNPTFPKEEIEKYKARLISQLQLQRSNPQFLAAERFSRVIYGDHPAGLVSPPVESVKKATAEDLARFHSTHYVPNNAMLAVVGDVTLKDLLPKIEREFGDWKRGDVPKVEIPAAPSQSESRIHLIDRPGSVQTVLQLGNLAIERTSPDYFSVLVMDKIVGGGPAARLFMNLREEKGYTYGAYSFFGGSKYRGTWQASSNVRTEVTDPAMKEFMYELKRIRDEKVSDYELENAKRALVGSFALSLEQPQSLLQNIITQKLFNLPADYWDTYPQKVAAVTAEDVQQAARKYVDLAHLQIVAVGDASKIREAMAKYGKVEVYDAEGK
ncbi:MAG TPA: pitrilysin family protein [Blastocatellia bacterium]|nr:pitrilysin family protein [Blastocatellia bacterium]